MSADPRVTEGADPQMAFVPQQWDVDCGIACLAMAAGVEYYDVIPALPFHAFYEGGVLKERIGTHQMPFYLGRLGVATRMVYDDAPDRPSGLRLMCVRGHYVIVLPNDTVHDPARGPNRPLSSPEYSEPFQVWELHRVVADYEPEDHERGCDCQRCRDCAEDARLENV